MVTPSSQPGVTRYESRDPYGASYRRGRAMVSADDARPPASVTKVE